MPRSRPGIALIQRPVNQPVEKHGCSPREDHADDNQREGSHRRPTVRSHNQRAERKRQSENRVRKTNQSQESRHVCAESDMLPGSIHGERLLQKAAKKTKAVIVVLIRTPDGAILLLRIHREMFVLEMLGDLLRLFHFDLFGGGI